MSHSQSTTESPVDYVAVQPSEKFANRRLDPVAEEIRGELEDLEAQAAPNATNQEAGR